MFRDHHGRMSKIAPPLLLVSTLIAVTACSSAAATNTADPGDVQVSQATSGNAAALASGNPAPSLSAPTQTSDRAGVTIAVTWTGPATGAVFEVKMDNHMIDLGSVDLTAATLTNDRGERLARPTWTGGASGHHRDDKLSYGATTEGTSPEVTEPGAFLAGSKWIQLELPAVGDSSPRDFRWDLPG
jgi:hypothetical protein